MALKETADAPNGNATWPALALVALSPIVAEVLPGATRFRALFVLPIEMCVWGGGALLIRHFVRRDRLGWASMLALALALAVAEECVIQQTSLAPMILKLRGETYARALGVNYVYFLWALVYEAVFVVFLPVYLVELIFPAKKDTPWIGRTGVVVTATLFSIGSFLAWFTWTRIARPSVFHVPVYTPPAGAMAIAVTAIAGLAGLALGPFRHDEAQTPVPRRPPAPWLVGLAGAIWAVLWYGLVLLGFGIAPWFPPAVAVGAGLLLAVAIVILLPRWAADPGWRRAHTFGLIFGVMLGSMAVGYIGFIGSDPVDLAFKIVTNVMAVGLMVMLGRRNP